MLQPLLGAVQWWVAPRLHDVVVLADRVRSLLRGIGIRLRHWRGTDRPAFGWDSLTGTEQRIAEIVGQGLSHREVASRMFLSRHTIAFHLRNVFWKLGITSRVG